METTPLMYLDLCAPLTYLKIENLPSEIHENEEFLIYYELDPAQSCSIEPLREMFAGKLIFTGQKSNDSVLPDMETTVLPAGKYAFAQWRGSSEMPEKENWLNMAIELQKDALWERYKLNNQLYVRYLYEDGLFVTQLFRPVN